MSDIPETTDQHGYKVHPSYGMILVSHARGSARLHASEIPRHEAFVRIVISEGRVVDDHHLLTRRHMAGEQVLVLELSQAQYAAMISAPNVGDGVPCTIARRDGQQVSRPPLQETSVERVRRQALEEARVIRTRCDSVLASTRQKLADAKVSKKRSDEILKDIGRVLQDLRSLGEYAEDTIQEASEDAISRIASEVDAMMTTTIHRLGIASLENRSDLLLGNGPGSDRSD